MNDHEARFWCAKLYIVSAISRTATNTTQDFHTKTPPITHYVTKFETTTPYTPALNLTLPLSRLLKMHLTGGDVHTSEKAGQTGSSKERNNTVP